MEDYPRDLLELEARFSTEEACRTYLFQLRWPDGFERPRCRGRKAWSASDLLWECAGCHRQISVTAGTILQDSRLPLTLWFRAVWWVTSQKNGVSAMGLQRVLGLKSYKTAWTMLHKLRHAMVRPGRDRLQGRVEVDEAFVGRRRGRSSWTPNRKQSDDCSCSGRSWWRDRPDPDAAHCRCLGGKPYTLPPGLRGAG